MQSEGSLSKVRAVLRHEGAQTLARVMKILSPTISLPIVSVDIVRCLVYTRGVVGTWVDGVGPEIIKDELGSRLRGERQTTLDEEGGRT